MILYRKNEFSDKRKHQVYKIQVYNKPRFPRFPFFLSIFSLLKKIEMIFETVEQQRRQNKQTNKQTKAKHCKLKIDKLPEDCRKKTKSVRFLHFCEGKK